jgi:hypothetical protein
LVNGVSELAFCLQDLQTQSLMMMIVHVIAMPSIDMEPSVAATEGASESESAGDPRGDVLGEGRGLA